MVGLLIAVVAAAAGLACQTSSSTGPAESVHDERLAARDAARAQKEQMAYALRVQERSYRARDKAYTFARRAAGFIRTVGRWLLSAVPYVASLEEWAGQFVADSWVHVALRRMRHVGDAIASLLRRLGLDGPAASPA